MSFIALCVWTIATLIIAVVMGWILKLSGGTKFALLWLVIWAAVCIGIGVLALNY